MRRALSILAFGFTLGVFSSATPVEGQQSPGEPPGAPRDTIDLVFEREVFGYPAFDRRNPFRPLSAADGGPRFEDLMLLGVIVSVNRSGSVATLAERPAGSPQAAPTRTHRLREGEVLGNSRVMEIREQMILVQVEEFGLFELRTLELRRMDPDRPPPAGPPPAQPGATDPGVLPGDPAAPALPGDPAAPPPVEEPDTGSSTGLDAAFIDQRSTGTGGRA